jgi:alcohol dehydrogenase class IV
MQFEFATATRVIFGPGTFSEAAPIATGFGRTALVVTTPTGVPAEGLLSALRAAGVGTVQFPTDGEPTMDQARLATRIARDAGVDVVLALGGGSVIDTAKAVAALLANGGEPEDYAEVIGRGLAIKQQSVPWIAIPTTAGTGAEVTSNAVLSLPEHGVKVSLRSPLMLPALALVDPDLTLSLPRPVTASTGLDGLTQLVEACVSCQANPLTDSLCSEGMARAGRSLRRAWEDGADRSAREDLALASLLSGLALANARLGAVHGIAGPLGGMIPAPHGVICARLLPLVMERNLTALETRAPGSPALDRYEDIARILTGNPAACSADGVAWVRELCRVFDIPPLSRFGLREQDFPEVAAKALKTSSMKGNPIALTGEELTGILARGI